MQYGILIGRFQPLHIGHQTIINEIIDDGRIPIIFIGSSNVCNEKNPLSYRQRVKLLNVAYPGILTLPLPDQTLNCDWANQLVRILTDINIDLQYNDFRLYFYNKEGDFDITPLVRNWFKVYRPVSKIPNISASQIRNDLDTYKFYMSPKVYAHYITMINTGVK